MTTPIQAAIEALTEARNWFETQHRVISKGGPSSWDMLQCAEQRGLLHSAIAALEAVPAQGSIDTALAEELKVAPFHLTPHTAYAVAAHIAQRAARGDVGAIVDYIYEMVGSIHRDDLIKNVQGMLAAPAPIADEVAGSAPVPVEAGDFPPLPEPDCGKGYALGSNEEFYSADQMHALVLADRAARAAAAPDRQHLGDVEDALSDLRKAVEGGASDEWLDGFIRQYPFSAAPAGHAEPVAWKKLTNEDFIDPRRMVDVVLSNGGYEYCRHISNVDWTQVQDWRYAAPVVAEPASTDFLQK